MGKKLVGLLARLKEEAESWRGFADGLQREVDNGIAIRQSAESKLARVQVLQCHADILERIIKEHSDG